MTQRSEAAPAPGETVLGLLLAGLSPQLDPALYVFAEWPHATPLPDGLAPLMLFHESEGVTLILRADEARRCGIAHVFPSRRITLAISSSLEAVGFLAALLPALAAAGIGVNPVSAFRHDHLFVPEDRADEAMAILRDLARKAQDGR